MTAREISAGYGGSIIVRRWIASWIDLVVVFLLVAFIGAMVGEQRTALLIFLSLTACFSYYIVLEGLFGRTLGRVATRTRVVDAAGGTPEFENAAIRTALRLIEVNPLLLGGIPAGLIATYSEAYQRLGDKLAGTYVLFSTDLAKLTPDSVAAVFE